MASLLSAGAVAARPVSRAGTGAAHTVSRAERTEGGDRGLEHVEVSEHGEAADDEGENEFKDRT